MVSAQYPRLPTPGSGALARFDMLLTRCLLQSCFTCPGQATVAMVERFGKFSRAAHPVRSRSCQVQLRELEAVRALLATTVNSRCNCAGFQLHHSVLR